MSLIWFHRFLISAAIVFCLGYGGWELMRFLDTGSTRSVLLAGAFAAAAVGLLYYLWHLGRILKLTPPPTRRPRNDG